MIFHFAASTYNPVDLVDCRRKRGVPSTRDSNTLQERQQLLIAAQRQQQLLIAAVLTSSNQLYLLAVGAVRGVTAAFKLLVLFRARQSLSSQLLPLLLPLLLL